MRTRARLTVVHVTAAFGAVLHVCQVVADAKLRVRFAAVNSMGSTHDMTSYDLTDLCQKIRAGKLPGKYYLSTDDAYQSGDQHVVPFGGKNLAPYQDAYNYYQSSQRIVVECTLGVVQARWGVLWRPLRCQLYLVPYVVMACFALHNLCIDAGMAMERADVELSRAIGEVDGAERVVGPGGAILDRRGGARSALNVHPRFQSQGYHDPSEVGRGRNAPCAIRSQRRERIAREVERRGWVRPPPQGRIGRRSYHAPPAYRRGD